MYVFPSCKQFPPFVLFAFVQYVKYINLYMTEGCVYEYFLVSATFYKSFSYIIQFSSYQFTVFYIIEPKKKFIQVTQKIVDLISHLLFKFIDYGKAIEPVLKHITCRPYAMPHVSVSQLFNVLINFLKYKKINKIACRRKIKLRYSINHLY